MRSSAAVASRALIMLACLVGIPALALSGASWSDVLKKIEDFRWPELMKSVAECISPPVKLDDAPAFATALPTPAGLTGSPPAAIQSPRSQVPTMASVLPGQVATPPQSAVVPAGYQAPADRDLSATASASPAADPFIAAQERLKQLGATYFLLESWGNRQQMYRFYCKMAIGGSAEYTRAFESTDQEPLQAVLNVLRQVETWRQGGLGNDDLATSH
jgi:hypothetical protein